MDSERGPVRGWLGYDWFKALVALVLAALLLYGALAGTTQTSVVVVPTLMPVAPTTALPQPTAAPQATAGALAAPSIDPLGTAVRAGSATISGTGSPGGSIDVLVDGISVGTAIVRADGTWSLPDVALAAGSREITAIAFDSSGAEVAAEPLPLTIRAAAPTLDLLATDLRAGPTTISGTGSPGSSVEVLVDDAVVGTATVGADGAWELPDVALSAGDHNIVARTVDAGGAGAATERVPVAVSAALVVPTLDPLPARVPAGPTTISGTGTPGSTVAVVINGEPLGIAEVAEDGTWELANVNLTRGEREIVARTLDNGAISAASPSSAALRVVVEPLAAATTPAGSPVATAAARPSATPAATAVAGGELVILAPLEGAELPAGTLTIRGTGEPETDIELLDSDRVLGQTSVAADGTWQIQVDPGQGTLAIGVRIKGGDEVVGKPIRVTVGRAQVDFCAGLEAGCQAWVTRAGGLSLRLRAGAGTDKAILANLPVGTEMELLEGPVQANGLPWFRVRTKGDQVGWVAGNNLVVEPD